MPCTYHLASPSILSSVLTPIPAPPTSNNTPRALLPSYHITTSGNTTSIFHVHPSAGWARPVACIKWGSSTEPKDRDGGRAAIRWSNASSASERLKRDSGMVDIKGQSVRIKDCLAKPSAFTSTRMVNAGDVSMAWNQCVYATPGFPYSVYIASDQTTTKSSSSSSSSSVPPPRFLAQLNIKRTKPPKTSRFKKAPASIRLEFRTEDEDEMDVVVLSTVLMVAGKFEWEKLAVIMVEGEVGATAAEAGSVLDWTAPPPLAIHRSHDSSRAGSHHDLPPAYA